MLLPANTRGAGGPTDELLEQAVWEYPLSTPSSIGSTLVNIVPVSRTFYFAKSSQYVRFNAVILGGRSGGNSRAVSIRAKEDGANVNELIKLDNIPTVSSTTYTDVTMDQDYFPSTLGSHTYQLALQSTQTINISAGAYAYFSMELRDAGPDLIIDDVTNNWSYT